MTQRKKSITIHETRSVVDITSILTQFGTWAALVLIVTGDGNCIQYREVNTRHSTQYTSEKKSKWKQKTITQLCEQCEAQKDLLTQSLSWCTTVNTICTQQHKGKTDHKNPGTSYFFFTIQLESNKNIQNQMQQRNLQHEEMHHNYSTTSQM